MAAHATVALAARASADLQAGRPVVITGGTDGAHGQLVFAAANASAETVAFTVRHSTGFLCAALDERTAQRLELVPMQGAPVGSRLLVSVDAAVGVSTGISAADRARTLRLLADAETTAADLTRPGHLVPLAVHPAGVLGHTGHAEAATDLLVVAGLPAVAGLAAVVSTQSPTGLATGTELEEFCAHHDLVRVDVDDLVHHRLCTEPILAERAQVRLPLVAGDFAAFAFRTTVDHREHLALVYGSVADAENIPVHVHRECVPADVFGTGECSCRMELDTALRVIATAGKGVLLYLRQHENGLVAALAGLSGGADAHLGPASTADLHTVASVFASLGIRSVALMESDLALRRVLEMHGLAVVAHEWAPRSPARRRRGWARLSTARAELAGHPGGAPPRVVLGVQR
jgi:3,4-dihydroxy 2-butanone 4-phosphate synthase/GTP cyclohydrolase II